MVSCGTYRQILGCTRKGTSRNDRVTNQNANLVVVAVVGDCRLDWVSSAVEVTELKPEVETTVVVIPQWKYAKPTTNKAADAVVTLEYSQDWNSLFFCVDC